MADIDPLAAATQTTPSVDPLAGWQPVQSAPATNTPPPPQKGILQTSFNQVPSSTSKGDPWANDPETQRTRSSFGEGYESSGSPSVSREGIRSFFTPETQQQMAGHWWGPAANFVGDVVGTGAADAVGVGNSIYTLGNQALSSTGMPPALQRDINIEGMRRVGEPTSLRQPSLYWKDAPAMQEFMQPPAPLLQDLALADRLKPSTDPVTSAAISLLRGNTPTAPPPPTPFTMTPGPQPGPAPAPPPTARPSGGLLNIPPAPGPPLPGTGFARAPVMTADEMLATSQGFYSPADKAAAAGATINSGAADGIRKVLTDTVPTDPEKAGYIGDNSLIQLGKTAQANNGQPMSYDTAMALDREMTARKQAAYGSNNATLGSQIGDAQDAVRAKMQSLTDNDTTGDPTTLANLQQARQAYQQYIKQSQLEDIQYRASLLPDDKQAASVKSQATALLKNDNKMRGWTDDEQGALEDAVKSGNIGTIKNLGITMIKPFAQAAGSAAGGAMFGPGGAYTGALVGGELATPWQAKLRAALSKISLDKVQQQLTAGVPPPVTNAPLSTQPGGINIPRAPTPSGSPAIFSYRNGVPYDAQGNPIAPTPQWQATARRAGLGQ